MKKALKTTFLYIGTAIGAGFSSGKEIALFFGSVSPLNVAIASVFMSLLCGFFLIAGKLLLMPKNKIMGFCIFFSAGISLCSMLAGGEFVLKSLVGIPMLGLVMAILGGVIVVLGIEKIKLLNTVLVPLIILSVALIFLKLDPQPYTLGFSLSKPILYSGLDVLLGGVIIADEGKELSYKEIALTCLMICGCLFVLLFMLQTVVLADGLRSSMPVLAVSERFGLKPVCGVLITAAIFTTLVSSLKIVSDKIALTLENLKKLRPLSEKKNRSLIVFGCLLIAYPISFVGFDAIVDTMYPFMSWCGVALTIIVFIKFILLIIKRVILFAGKRKGMNKPLHEKRNEKLKGKNKPSSEKQKAANNSPRKKQREIKKPLRERRRAAT